MRHAGRSLIADVLDGVLSQAEAGHEPAVVEPGLVVLSPLEELLGDVRAGGLPDPVQGIPQAAESGVYAGDRVDAVADLPVNRTVISPVQLTPTLELVDDFDRFVVDHRRDLV